LKRSPPPPPKIDVTPAREQTQVPDLKKTRHLFHLLETLGVSWDERFGRLQAFKAREGHANVPAKYPADPTLGNWCSMQRVSKNKGALSADRIAKLEGLGFVWDPQGAAWDEMFGRLQAFKAREGHVDVPQKYPADPTLGNWCNMQRASKNKGALSADRIAKLEGVGFEWDPLGAAWDERFGQLQAFKAREGHANVPQKYPADPPLGKWCSHQRQLKKRDQLSAERIQRLEALGFRVGDEKETALKAVEVAFSTNLGRQLQIVYLGFGQHDAPPAERLG